jgi:hypothetical protein
MQIDVVLCDHGQVSGDKLFISGGGIDRMYVGADAAPYVVNFGVAGTITVPPTEAAADHVLNLRLETEGGQPAPLVGEAGGRDVGGDLHLTGSPSDVVDDQTISFAFNFQGVPLTATGAYVLVASLDGQEVRWLRFRVEVPR